MTQTIRRSDMELRANVSAELLFNPSIDAARVGVAADDGRVTLTGEVSTLPERHVATRAAMRVGGVKAVTDDMVVRDPGTSGPNDADIGEAAKQMLYWAVDVPSDAVKAAAQNHMVTLSGTVTWQYQRQAAARAVMYLKGVTAVNNTILLTATVPTSGVKAAIDAAIQRNTQLDSREITVDANGGEVTLRGTVRSWAERLQAEYVAWSASGVTSLKDDLAVIS